MKKSIYRTLGLVIAGVAFFILPYVFSPYGFPELLQLGTNPHERSNLVSTVLIVAFFYLSYFVLIPRFFFPKKYVVFAGLSFMAFLCIVGTFPREDFKRERPRQEKFSRSWVMPSGEEKNLPPPQEFWEKPPLDFALSQKLFMFLLALFLSLSLRINDRWQQSEQDRLQTELSYLKAQINPHFLFNTLNSIYSLAIEKSDATADAIVQLSSFMRYVIRDAQNDLVPLKKELDYIEQYVALQKIRLDDTVQLQYSNQGQASQQKIAPLLLISFIENAFKYGVNPEGRSEIIIRVRVDEHQLRLFVFNQKVRLVPSDENAGGIGLRNTKARLELLYPDRHDLQIQDTENTFTIELTLKL
ncbi:hypothetical protein BWI96_20360 [Siphonobacter sp. SORGH_AS_0500]|uniref:sensor histidine kinase n=1 Tax=Siphonobacter sp. SORGH_AS_0500 TaxID=1864824 RepID=UPI000CACE695|nr:histidine kinase [Siphonobacter sp. SORGH_AS_0500]PKK34807.1 hypothetical protein BWI96_20360 [Siphonobacter sp. SORGH_AS_0500]